ncbi:CBS domain-containing protein [Pelagibacteraceae bacterium]|jgi:CBS domain-containing protein|nr:CBS domain-containing protein [Pelagibacteraceae bacterium]|tara:strand:+ start:113 stop:541 length:429 start_codon:yes stop_codon:yes gene_type:complete
MAGRLVRKLAERDCYSLGENDTLKTTSEALAKNNLGAMPIIDSSGKVIGIISERDIARKIHQENFSNNELVTNIMTKKIISCDLNISVTELMETMTEKKIRHMLIMNNDELKGIVSIGDVVNHLIENYKEENENLRNYINNS